MEVFKWELKSLNVSLFYIAFRWKIEIIALKKEWTLSIHVMISLFNWGLGFVRRD